MAATVDVSEAAVEAPLLVSNDVVEGSIDYMGRPARRSKSGRWGSAYFVISVEMAERFAYAGIGANLINYLTGTLGQSTAAAAASFNAWDGTGALLPLLGAFVADSFLGRYRTIIVASVLYILAFGADQFDGQDPEEAKAKSSFFNWWYLLMCAAITVTYVILTYIQENISWGLGFGIPCLVMCVALICFLIGTMTYRFRVPSNESDPFLRVGRVFVEAARNWRSTSSAIYMEESENPHIGSQQFKFLNKALVRPNGLEEGRKVCSVSEVEEARAVLKLFPIMATCLVYGIVFPQSSTVYTKQGVTMDRSISPSLKIPAASLQSLVTLSIVVFVATYDRVFLPIARGITRKPSGITMLQRIGAGMFLSILTMVTAALVEMKRLKTAREYGLVDKPNAVVPMSVTWLVPQYLLLGISESLTMVGLQEFFYDQVPNQLKSTGLALYLSIFGLGDFLSSILITLIEKATGGHGHDGWFSDNLNKANLDYFYWLLGALSAVAFAAFLYVTKSYVYYEPPSRKHPNGIGIEDETVYACPSGSN